MKTWRKLKQDSNSCDRYKVLTKSKVVFFQSKLAVKWFDAIEERSAAMLVLVKILVVVLVTNESGANFDFFVSQPCFVNCVNQSVAGKTHLGASAQICLADLQRKFLQTPRNSTGPGPLTGHFLFWRRKTFGRSLALVSFPTSFPCFNWSLANNIKHV